MKKDPNLSQKTALTTAGLILLFSLMAIIAMTAHHSHAQTAATRSKPSSPPTDTSTVTPTDTPDPTPSPSPTPSPTPSPPPSPTPSPTPTQEPTAMVTPQPTATATHAATATTTPKATQTPAVNSPSTSLPTPQTTATFGNEHTNTGSGNSVDNGMGIMFISVAIGGVISLGAVFTLGVFILRKRLTPVKEKKLPPSGARPWKLSRDASLHGNTALYGRNAEQVTFVGPGHQRQQKP